jgi:hypothetical protein
MDFYDDDEYDNYEDEDEEVLPQGGETPESPDRVHDLKLGIKLYYLHFLFKYYKNNLYNYCYNFDLQYFITITSSFWLTSFLFRSHRHHPSFTQVLILNSYTTYAWILSFIADSSFPPFISSPRYSTTRLLHPIYSSPHHTNNYHTNYFHPIFLFLPSTPFIIQLQTGILCA